MERDGEDIGARIVTQSVVERDNDLNPRSVLEL